MNLYTRDFKKSLSLAIACLFVLGITSEAAAEESFCEGYDKKQRIGRMGGRNAFTKTPVSSPADLNAQLEKHRSEIEAIMKDKGVGHLTEALYAAAASGEGLSERDLERGEVFHWMTFRKRSSPMAFGPMCFNAKKAYSAYVIEVTEETAHPATAKCALKASGGACVENEISVDAGGSSAGVEVEMRGPGGAKKIISGSGTTWTGLPSAAGTYTFHASAKAQGTKTVTTHTFVIPKICLNLAYVGSTTEKMDGDVDTCQQTATVKVDECKPSCSINVSPTQVKRGEMVEVAVSGKYDAIEVELTGPKGQVSTLTDFPATVKPRKRGIYTLKGTATNSVGSASCESQFELVKPKADWTVRGFGVSVDPDDNAITESLIRPSGVSERSRLTLDRGEGLGVSLERHFNPRIGLEASVMVAQLDSSLFFDLGNDWEEDSADVDMLAFMIGPNFHLTPDKRVDFYIGPFIGLVDFGDAIYRVLGETKRRDFDNEDVIGLQLGLDVPFGKKGWAFHVGARYMDLSTEIEEEGPELSLDPIVATVGFAYKF